MGRACYNMPIQRQAWPRCTHHIMPHIMRPLSACIRAYESVAQAVVSTPRSKEAIAPCTASDSHNQLCSYVFRSLHATCALFTWVSANTSIWQFVMCSYLTFLP